MTTDFITNAKRPAALIAAVALLIGLALLASQMLLRMEVVTTEIRSVCGEGRSIVCFFSLDLWAIVSRAPWAFLINLALIPACLALVVMRLQEPLPPHLKALIGAAMWVAFACYLVVPILILSFPSSLSDPDALAGGAHFPPLSASSSEQADAIHNLLRFNGLSVAILGLLTLFSFSVSGSTRQRTAPAGLERIGCATLLIAVILAVILYHNGFLMLVSVDRSFGTEFFDPTSTSDQDSLTYLLEGLGSLKVSYLAAAVSCLGLWVLAKR